MTAVAPQREGAQTRAHPSVAATTRSRSIPAVRTAALAPADGSKLKQPYCMHASDLIGRMPSPCPKDPCLAMFRRREQSQSQKGNEKGINRWEKKGNLDRQSPKGSRFT